MANKFTTVGVAWLIDKSDTTLATKMEYIGWGTGAGTTAIGDTTLFTEVDTRIGPSGVTTTLDQSAADTSRLVGTMTASTGRTITNAGSWTASSGGTLIVKGDFTGVVLITGDSIAFTITLQITTS